MWHATFHADQASFERGIRNQVGRGALERRIELLYPLATGNIGRFLTLIRTGLSESPSETLRFLDQMVQRLELEDAGVRTAHLPTLKKMNRLLQPLMAEGEKTGRRGRTATALVERSQAIVEGLVSLGPDASART